MDLLVLPLFLLFILAGAFVPTVHRYTEKLEMEKEKSRAFQSWYTNGPGETNN